MTDTTVRNVVAGAGLVTVLVTTVVFGLLAMEHGLSLFSPRHELAATVTSSLTSSARGCQWPWVTLLSGSSGSSSVSSTAAGIGAG